MVVTSENLWGGLLKITSWQIIKILTSVMTYHPPFRGQEPLLSLDRHLSLKICLLLALAFAKRLSELHSLEVKRSRGWTSCTFSYVPGFVAKAQDPTVLDVCFIELLSLLSRTFWMKIDVALLSQSCEAISV